MKSDMTSNVAPKSTVDENSTSSVSNGASSNSNSGATTGEDLSNGGGGVVVSNSNSSVGGAVGNGGISISLQSSSLIGGGGVTALSSLALETAGITLGVPQPAHQASNIILTRAFASFDGIHSGVPTKTTPTLTPTTLKNIEQTFMELTNDTSSNIPCQAGFVPPPFQFEDHSQDQENSRESMSSDVSNNSWQVTPPPVISEDLDSKSSSTSYEREATVSQPRLMAATVCGGVANLAALTPSHAMQQGASGGNRKQAGQNAGAPGTSRRNMGGRRPAKANNLSPEEEQKRAVRRERNKQAAARCRRRREDHTNELVDETDLLEKKKQALQDEIKQLLNEKEDLEFLLETHKEHCRFHGRHSPVERKPVELIQQQHLATDLKVILPMKIKAEPEEHPEQPPAKKLILSNALSDSLDTPTPTTITPVLTSVNLPRLMLPTTAINGRPARPASLDVKASTAFPLRNITADAGIGISTPSNGFFNFDSLMDGGTGLTPVAAPISLQSNRGPLDLMTPTSSEPSKLYSL